MTEGQNYVVISNVVPSFRLDNVLPGIQDATWSDEAIAAFAKTMDPQEEPSALYDAIDLEMERHPLNVMFSAPLARRSQVYGALVSVRKGLLELVSAWEQIPTSSRPSLVATGAGELIQSITQLNAVLWGPSEESTVLDRVRRNLMRGGAITSG
jgi:hypothetical protein